jgi:lipooligosaccharide transport system permease protein
MYGGTFLIIITVFGLVHSWTALLVLPLLLLSGAMFAAPAICVSTLANAFEQMFYYITLVITPMFTFSGIFSPHPAPSWYPGGDLVHALYHVAHVARACVLGRLSIDLWSDVAWMCVFTALALLFPASLIQRKLLV